MSFSVDKPNEIKRKEKEVEVRTSATADAENNSIFETQDINDTEDITLTNDTPLTTNNVADNPEVVDTAGEKLFEIVKASFPEKENWTDEEVAVNLFELDHGHERAGVGLPDDLNRVLDLVHGDDDGEDIFLAAGKGARTMNQGCAMGNVGHDDFPEVFLCGYDFDLHLLIPLVDHVDHEHGHDHVDDGEEGNREGDGRGVSTEGIIGHAQ